MKEITKKILEIIRQNFPNGIRADFIDTNKIRKLYSANYPADNITQNIISEIIRTNGIENNERFYFISDENAEKLRFFFEKIWSENSIVYYSKIYEKNANFLFAMHIFSPEVLKKLLQKIFCGPFYFSEFCTAKIGTRLDYIIADIFTKNSMSLAELQENLPYVPAEEISAILEDKKKYLPTKNGRYFQISKIQFDLEEISSAKKQISTFLNKTGCALPENYSLSSNFALNPNISEKDLRNLIYEKFFSANFNKKGNKIFKKGGIVTKKSTLLREFISEQKELSLKKLFAVAEELGLLQKEISLVLSVANEMMIRVNRNLFVKDSLINFNVAEIDKALSSFVNGKIISLRSVTSFTGFPPVEGYLWNWFLLENFLRKYSQKYVYNTTATNNSSIGAIYPASMKFENYLDVQVAAVIQEKIPSEKSAIENFLIEQGFRSKRIDKITERILQKSQEFLKH